MKNKLLVICIISAALVIISGCGTGTGIQINTPETGSQTSTPTASGQVNVQGFNVQFNAPGPNPLMNTVSANNNVAGILRGIWHGVISPVTLIISFLNSNVQMYEVHNDGSAYNLGFLVGVAIIFLILGIIAGRRR
jgi:hypothetical protein